MSAPSMPPGPRVALVVDHPRRDLAGLVLVALALAARGATCHLVPLHRPQELWALAPDFVLLNYFRAGSDVRARQLAEVGIGIGALDTEGGVWAEVESYTELLWTDAALRRRLRPVCMWGPVLADALVAREILSADQVVVTGCPRFDFYHPRWRPVLADAAAATAPLAPAGPAVPAGPLLLLNTNFSCSNPRFATAERNAAQLREEFAWSTERVQAYMATEQAALAEMIRLARRLAADFPAATVLLRPHPFENTTPYETALADEPRVIVDASGPVAPRIFRAAAVIQRSCSTAVEAGLAGVPALSPQWITPAATIPVAEMVSVPCASYEALRATVAAILGGSFAAATETRACIETVTRDWFHAADGRAHQRVADAVWNALGDRRVDERRCRRHLYDLHRGTRAPLPARLGGRVRQALLLSPDWSFRRWRTIPAAESGNPDKLFDAAMVRDLVARITAAGRDGAADGTDPAHASVGAPVQVASAAERDDFRCALRGVAVTIAPAPRAHRRHPAGATHAASRAGA